MDFVALAEVARKQRLVAGVLMLSSMISMPVFFFLKISIWWSVGILFFADVMFALALFNDIQSNKRKRELIYRTGVTPREVRQLLTKEKTDDRE
jgi:hypothetical protein